MTSIHVTPVRFEDQNWKAVTQIRTEVFVVEQAVDEAEEYDEFEESCRHFLATVEGKPAGTARWRKTDKGYKLERFAVLKAFRRKGVGSHLVHAALEEVLPIASPSKTKIYLHAQVQAMPFYKELGFVAFGPEFTEAEILHRAMAYDWDQISGL